MCVTICIHTAALTPPFLSSVDRRRQKTHRPSGAPHADFCAQAPHGNDALRRLEARQRSCCHTAICVLLPLPDLDDSKRVTAGRDDVLVLLVPTGRTLHEVEETARELADLPAQRDVPKAHCIVFAAADDLRSVVADRYLSDTV